ncbi:MAG: HDOD domain-containing protein [Burkholderiaceae bacterium]
MSALPAATASRTPHDVQGWVRWFQQHDIPVLASTAAALEDLRAIEDDVDARRIAEVVGRDPLMTLKVLIHASMQGSNRRLTDAETVLEALVLMGITPFFRAFGPQLTIESHLGGHPQALAGLQRVLRRAERAARFAASFAIHRADHDAVVLHEAAQLHDFTEMLLWLHAPGLALELQRRQQADPDLRSAVVQRDVLNAELNDIQHVLMKVWHLPDMLVRITDDRHAENSQVRNVVLAIRVARHSTAGWENPALPDDVRDIAALLHLGPEPTRQLLLDIDRD